MARPKPVRFTAEIYKSGIQRCVQIPERVSTQLGAGSRIPVLATTAGEQFQTTLVPTGDGRHRMFVSGNVRKKLGVDAGDEITIQLRLDPAEGEAAHVPRDLIEALEFAQVRHVFDGLTPRQRREIVDFVERAKRPETREKYIARAVNVVAERDS